MSDRDERRLVRVPAPVLALLGAALAFQIAVRFTVPHETRLAEDLPAAPSTALLRLASLGETALAARLAMVYLQGYDLNSGNAAPYQRLDYDLLVRWLQVILDTDPNSEYPLFMAARIYAEVPDVKKMRKMLSFIHERFLEDPNHRWPSLAHAALLAKHRLRDLPLARQYAADLSRLASGPSLPLWAREMESFVLEDMGEKEAARIVLGGLVASGRISDPDELRFLEFRIKQLDSGQAPGSGGQIGK